MNVENTVERNCNKNDGLVHI